MSTPGRRRALKALADRKRINVDRVASGLPPLVADSSGKLKPVSAASVGLTKEKALASKARRK